MSRANELAEEFVRMCDGLQEHDKQIVAIAWVEGWKARGEADKKAAQWSCEDCYCKPENSETPVCVNTIAALDEPEGEDGPG